MNRIHRVLFSCLAYTVALREGSQVWKCQKCHEESEDSFDACWRCRLNRDGTTPSEVLHTDQDRDQWADADVIPCEQTSQATSEAVQAGAMLYEGAKNHIRSLSDSALTKYAEDTTTAYTPEAIAFARQEVLARGLGEKQKHASRQPREVVQSFASTAEAFAMQHTGGERVRVAGVVYWNVVETEADGGLAGRAVSGPKARDLGLGVAFGPLGVIASTLLDKPARRTCELGVLVVGDCRVFLVCLGRVPMRDGVLSADLVNLIPKSSATSVSRFRPLDATVNRAELRIQVLGKPPAGFGGDTVLCTALDSAAGGWVGPESLGAAIRELCIYPLPQDAMGSILIAGSEFLDRGIEDALRDYDYAESFVLAYRAQNENVRYAMVLVAHRGPEWLKETLAKALGRRGNPAKILGGNPYALLFTGLSFLGFCMLLGALFLHGVTDGYGTSNESNSAAFLSIALFPLGVLMVQWCLGSWWSDRCEARVEQRMLRGGGGFGGQLDAFLALVALDRDWQAQVRSSDVEGEMARNPCFARRVCTMIHALDAERRKKFIASAPSTLREAVLRAVATYEGPSSRSGTIFCLAIWLPCLMFGVYGIVRGFPLRPAPAYTVDWYVLVIGVFMGFGGAVPALTLCVKQIGAWRVRRWARDVGQG